MPLGARARPQHLPVERQDGGPAARVLTAPQPAGDRHVQGPGLGGGGTGRGTGPLMGVADREARVGPTPGRTSSECEGRSHLGQLSALLQTSDVVGRVSRAHASAGPPHRASGAREVPPTRACPSAPLAPPRPARPEVPVADRWTGPERIAGSGCGHRAGRARSLGAEPRPCRAAP